MIKAKDDVNLSGEFIQVAEQTDAEQKFVTQLSQTAAGPGSLSDVGSEPDAIMAINGQINPVFEILRAKYNAGGSFTPDGMCNRRFSGSTRTTNQRRISISTRLLSTGWRLVR